ncbi:MAG: zinc ribbon domain-containing protein [Clostridia bacterium]|nr:zinc ribbon domain-containing protein [Clostridia bacterium]
MAFCSKCGKEVHEKAEICVHCGCRIKAVPILTGNDGKKSFVFFLLFSRVYRELYFNHSNLKPQGWKSRTYAYFFLSAL